MLELIGKQTSSSEELLRLIKIDEGKYENEIGVSFLSSIFCFTTKALGVTFATNAAILGVRIMP
jgi:hypothetical protein